MPHITYASRSAAIRAARNAAKEFFGTSYEAFEGPDYSILHVSVSGEARRRYYYKGHWA